MNSKNSKPNYYILALHSMRNFTHVYFRKGQGKTQTQDNKIYSILKRQFFNFKK